MAFRHSLNLWDALLGILGAIIGGLTHFWPWLAIVMEGWEWQVPIWTAVAIVGIRLLLSPYWAYTRVKRERDEARSQVSPISDEAVASTISELKSRTLLVQDTVRDYASVLLDVGVHLARGFDPGHESSAIKGISYQQWRDVLGEFSIMGIAYVEHHPGSKPPADTIAFWITPSDAYWLTDLGKRTFRRLTQDTSA